ncbi:MAG: Tol-Pal system beta propeller repeat protein TolB [Endomicrobium sp.]|nr:Tol-Pal system beta propeller repeat protein TolB [Endomicrobium sp.]
MKVSKYLIFIFLFCCSVCFAHNDVYLSLCATAKRSDIGVDDFFVVSKDENSLKCAKALKNIIENDLVLCRYFNVIKNESEDVNNQNQEKLFIWEQKGASVVLCATVAVEGENVILNIKMLDVGTGETIWTHEYKNEVSKIRYLAHQASDEIVKRFTGEIGVSSSKIVFVNDSTRFKELYIVDYDGYNLRRLTRDKKINILPKWSPDGEEIIYTSYLYRNPDLFSLNLVKNKRRIISKYQGLNVTGSFSPDGEKIVLTLSRGRFPNLYLLGTNGEIIQRLTNGFCIDTSPSFSPSGQEIVFISDRSGYPQLHLMDIDGGNVRRLTTSEFCDSPAWSPRGDKIVFTMRKSKGNYDLYIYDLPTGKITQLTNKQKRNENPSWSPDGRFVVFSSTRSDKSEIYIMAIDGSGVRKLVEIPGSSYTPSWSPLLKKD